jgi:hypothetical protein
MSAGQIDPISDDSFIDEWERIHHFALDAGVDRVPLIRESASERRRFFRDVHRAYEMAQRTIAEQLRANATNEKISTGERLHRQLALRKLADAMAYTMAQGQTHIIRRLAINRQLSDLPFEKLPEYLKAAEALNEDSRQTFALVADLTTFVQMGDLLRIDVRAAPSRLTVVELKTGEVNERLATTLKEIVPSAESIAELKARADLSSKEIRQAQRMLRQRLRGNRLSELLREDKGVDPGTGTPMRLSAGTIATSDYDSILERLLDLGKEKGAAYVSIEGCLHLGVHYNATAASWAIARAAATEALVLTATEDAVRRKPQLERLTQPTDDGTLSFCTDPYLLGLLAAAVRPFSLWRIPGHHRAALMTQRARVSSIIDIIGLAVLFGERGLVLEFSSRKDAARYAGHIGGSEIPLVGNRALKYETSNGPVVLLNGTLSRFFYELVRPGAYITGVANEDSLPGQPG